MTQQVDVSLGVFVIKSEARVATSKMSSTPSPVKAEHSR